MTAGKRHQIHWTEKLPLEYRVQCEDVKMIFVSQMSALLYTTTIWLEVCFQNKKICPWWIEKKISLISVRVLVLRHH